MAATRATCQGFTKRGLPRNKPASRLGGGSVEATVATWRTFCRATMLADGTGTVEVSRDGKIIGTMTWDESERSKNEMA